MKKSIVISIVNGTLFPETGKLHTVFHLREASEGIRLSDRLELHFIELGKVPERKPIASLTPVERLAAYLKFAGDETKEDYVRDLIQSGGDAIKMTEHLFRELTEDEIAYERNERKLKYELGRNTQLAHARKEGIEKGMEKGIAAGREEGETLQLIKQVCKKLAKSKPVAQIAAELEEDPAHIERICAAAVGCAPDFDAEEIYDKLMALPDKL